MAYREMTLTEICRRIGQGDLVVYVDEEYGYRYWFWFPDMTEDELRAYWEKCNIEDHFFSPTGLPGDMVPVPPEECDGDCITEADVLSYYDEAYNDKRSSILLTAKFNSASSEEKQNMIAEYDAWLDEYFPAEAVWKRGFASKDSWRAHTHMEDDSWLKTPGE